MKLTQKNLSDYVLACEHCPEDEDRVKYNWEAVDEFIYGNNFNKKDFESLICPNCKTPLHNASEVATQIKKQR